MFGIDDAIAAGSNLITTIINKVAPDANEVERNKIQQALTMLNQHHEQVLAQLEINKVEAASADFRVAGWRPAIGWVGAFGLAYQLIFRPIINGLLAIFGLPSVFVTIDIELLQSLIGGLTGLVLARSWDKTKGVDTKQFTN
jgi:hypothetical protein